MNIKKLKKLNEQLDSLLESTGYKLTIITGRDRDSDGELTKTSFEAENDVDAFIKVLKEYNTCASGYFNGDYEDNQLKEQELEFKQFVLKAAESGENQAEAITKIAEYYNDMMDISDYYDDIVTLNRPDGSIVFEDNIDIDDWFGDDEDDLDEEE